MDLSAGHADVSPQVKFLSIPADHDRGESPLFAAARRDE